MNGLQSYLPAKQVIRVAGTVSNGVNIRVGSIAVVINEDAVTYLEPRIGSQPGIRHDANPDDNQVGRNLRAVGKIDCSHMAVSRKTLDAGRQKQLYAMVGMLVLVELRYLR